MKFTLDVQYAVDRSGLPTKKDFRAWALAAYTAAGGEAAPDTACEVSLRIVDEAESAILNERYRDKPNPTNVLAFPAELPGVVGLRLLGDLAICAPVVEREAREQGKPLGSHYAHLVVHGMLHLLGYDHESEAEAGKMEALETTVLAGLGISDPY